MHSRLVTKTLFQQALQRGGDGFSRAVTRITMLSGVSRHGGHNHEDKGLHAQEEVETPRGYRPTHAIADERQSIRKGQHSLEFPGDVFAPKLVDVNDRAP